MGMMAVKWAVVVIAADGTVSAAGPFPSDVQAEGWAAQLELETEGALGGHAVILEAPAAAMAEAVSNG